MKDVIFTICAKNYLAQALTLRESMLKHNDLDFFIFLADDCIGIEDVENVVYLNDLWIKDWRQMAFKYDVIEFSTSIKPFSINYLFNMGYDKVVYLDPDIYVTDSLSLIFDTLAEKAIVLTPHYCEMIEKYNGAVSENVLMADGVFNLGFVAIRNNSIGKNICNWWMNRLSDQCYADKWSALFVDQKWMDFIPGFFPVDTSVSTHMGMNVAIWNLHERTLSTDGSKYFIVRNRDQVVFPLLFFHFSGFDPFHNTVINRRHPQFSIEVYPSFKPIIEEYRALLYKNGYERFSILKYAYASFENGRAIIPLHRRLYRAFLENYGNTFDNDPFSEKSNFYSSLKKNRLLIRHKQVSLKYVSEKEQKKVSGLEAAVLKPLLKLVLIVFGAKIYSILITAAGFLAKKEYHYFLIERKN